VEWIDAECGSSDWRGVAWLVRDGIARNRLLRLGVIVTSNSWSCWRYTRRVP
jgi:hypothetical protein